MEYTLLIDKLKILPNKHKLIGVVGGGGKTTLIYLLARELERSGYKVAITTTTHMWLEERYGFTPIGITCEDGKIKGISSDFPKTLLEKYDIVLVEADGSKRFPIKIPKDYEPVLPCGVDLVIGVAGASAIGKKWEQSCHRYELVEKYFKYKQKEIICLEDILEILLSENGQKKGVKCEYRYVINQSDILSLEDMEKAKKMVKETKECGCLLSLKEWDLRNKK